MVLHAPVKRVVAVTSTTTLAHHSSPFGRIWTLRFEDRKLWSRSMAYVVATSYELRATTRCKVFLLISLSFFLITTNAYFTRCFVLFSFFNFYCSFLLVEQFCGRILFRFAKCYSRYSTLTGICFVSFNFILGRRAAGDGLWNRWWRLCYAKR